MRVTTFKDAELNRCFETTSEIVFREILVDEYWSHCFSRTLHTEVLNAR